MNRSYTHQLTALPVLPRLIRFVGELGLTPRLISFMVIVAAVPVILIGIFSFNAGSQGIQRHTRSHLTSVVTVKSQEVERWFRPLEAASSASARADLQRYFSGTIQRNTGLRQISLVSPGGTLLLGTTDGSSMQEITLPPPARLISRRTHVHLPAYVPGDDAKPAIITVPVLDGQRVLAYAVVEASAIPLFETLSPDAGLGRNGKIYLVTYKEVGRKTQPDSQSP